jgi:hypothetical protein
MKALRRSVILAAAMLVILAAGVQEASAVSFPGNSTILLGTTGACNNAFQGGPCTQTSTLVQLDPRTGGLMKEIGPVGFTVNGLAWDHKSGTLYASTAIGDVAFHGLITIDPKTGEGTPVDATVHNFGLGGSDSPIHSITIDNFGQMVGWYDEFPGADGLPVTDTFVRIDKETGVATEFSDTGIDTSANGLSFGKFNLLWNIDTSRRQSPGAPLTQTAYLIDPSNGKPLLSRSLSPPTMAALGDFNPMNDLYYGLNFTPFDPTAKTFIVVVDLDKGTVTTLGQTFNNLHTLAFVRGNGRLK